jgi:hypothetical protein
MPARRWTPKAALARSRKNLVGAIERLRAVAYEWGDIDQGIVGEADDQVRALESFLESIEEGIGERMAEDPEFGK